ncbi:regulator of chromosome condensation 1/beta-lactamase-inhibitor protein II [Mycena rosella]|uniref:Regulator of chromosome condensation 1/beta-lactamase-inhibitor protein II n=1 Tax=Mycena rosella TaxID=1033263 RepID=A0AAD7DKE2_MYCRO|nr:regulator of chromosome condensation 1/beta-lactamase-inhibitor protein II [Mycena rosella]
MAKKAAATPKTTRKRAADDTGRSRKRARVQPAAPLNPIPGPSQSTEKHILLVHGAVDAGQLGLSDDQEKEVMRPRVHPLVLQLVTEDKMGPSGLEGVAAGGMHSLILDSNGKVWSFGLNDSLALGRLTKPPDGTPDNIPELVLGLDGFRATAIVASDNLSIAISETGELRAWGTFNSDGLLGFMGHKDKVMVPTALPAFSKKLICAAACGEDHALALTCDGTVYAWGNGASFQLGRRILERRKENGLKPEPLPLRDVVAVFAGTHNSFAVDRAGAVFAWGLNQMRQTGVDDAEPLVKTPTEVHALHPDNHAGARVVQIAGGEHHTHFLFDSGAVWACGRAGADRLGLADDHPRVRPKRDDFLVITPVRVAFPPPPTPADPAPVLPPYTAGFSATRIAHISAGERYTLAVDEDGILYSWGEGNASQLGLGNESNAQTPTRVANTALKGHRVVVASAGGQHVLLVGVKRDGTL